MTNLPEYAQTSGIIGLDEVIPVVLEILATTPEARFGYQSQGGRACMYFYADGKPCCVIGHVFHRFGIEKSALRYSGRNDINLDPNTCVLWALDLSVTRRFTENAIRYMTLAQSLQDQNITWGEVKWQLERRQSDAAAS